MKKGRVIFDLSIDTVESLIEKNNSLGVVFRRNNTNVYGNKSYSYLSIPEDLKIGDLVVVESGDSFALATFVGYDPISPKGCELKHIVSKVDVSALFEIKAKERRKAEIKEMMMEKKAKLEETIMYEMLAEKDPDMKALLEEFKELNK